MQGKWVGHSDVLRGEPSALRAASGAGLERLSGATASFPLGGAFSVDYRYRTPDKDWWANEEPTREEASALITGGPLDLLITHDAPAGVPLKGDFELEPELAEKAERTRFLLAEVVDSVRVPHVFCGHWHQRRIYDLRHSDGTTTRVDVLNMENTRHGNGVLVWPGKAPLRVESLEIRGR